jgi:hypothetical protein
MHGASPLDFLALVLSVTAAAVVWQEVIARQIRAQLLQLAREWGMHYSPGDRFNMAAALAPRLPMPGASNVRVVDLIYGLEQGFYRYVCRVQYTTGVMRSKHRHGFVVAFREPRGSNRPGAWTSFTVAPTDISIIEQFQHLKDVVVDQRAGA